MLITIKRMKKELVDNTNMLHDCPDDFDERDEILAKIEKAKTYKDLAFIVRDDLAWDLESFLDLLFEGREIPINDWST